MKSVKNVKTILPISIVLGCFILGGFYYLAQLHKQESIEKQKRMELNVEKKEREPWKPEKELYDINKLIEYGVIDFKVLSFGQCNCYDDGFLSNTGERRLTYIEIMVQNDYTNVNNVYLSNQVFIIKDSEDVYKPVVFDDKNLKPSIRAKSLKSGEIAKGYLFFEETEFNNPILEYIPFSGSYPVKVNLEE